MLVVSWGEVCRMFASLCVYPHMCPCLRIRALCVRVNAQALWSAAPVTTPLGFPGSLLPHEAGPGPLPSTEGGRLGVYPVVLPRQAPGDISFKHSEPTSFICPAEE